jgi:hypothetical protein
MTSRATPDRVEATLTFLERSSPRPTVLMPRHPVDRIERTGTYREVPVTIHDARQMARPPMLDREGFELVRAPTAVADFGDPAVVQARHYPEVVDLLKRRTGATEVRIFDHTVRVQGEPGIAGTGQRQPVAFVHNDYTEHSARQRVHDLFSPTVAERLLAGRVALVNVWRSIGASAERFPLAAADGRTVPPGDYVAVDIVYPDRLGEIYHVMYSPGQRWFYFAGMRNDEAMLLKCFDSAADGRTRYTAHAGFENPGAAPDTPPRRSIEVRSILSFAT